MIKKFLSLQQAATLLDVHPETLRRWDREGRLKAIKVSKRGDRKYRYDDLLKLIGDYRPETYKNYEIIHYGYGFEPFPDRFGSLAKFIVKRVRKTAGFAFAVGGLKLFAYPNLTDSDLIDLAKKKIKQRIDKHAIQHLKEYTYEFDMGEFSMVKNPDWWNFGGL